MARKQVIAYYMHEHEMSAARDAMPGAETTESFAFGSLEDAQIADLRNKGLIVQEIRDSDKPAAEPEFAAIHGVARAAAMAAPADAAAAPAPDLNRPQFYLLWLAGPLLSVWRAALDKLGVKLLESLPTRAYIVRLEPGQFQKLKALPFVENLRIYDRPNTAPDQLTRRTVAPSAPGTGRSPIAMLAFDIRLHRPEDAPAVQDWLKTRRIPIAGSSARKIRVYLAENAAEIGEIPALPEVAGFEEYVAPKLSNDRARRLLAIDWPNPGIALNETGAGQIVAVADTGLDDQHPDFANRKVGIVALGRPGNASDPHGHGTHVAGSVLGDGSASGGQLRGAAPGARLFFQSLLDAQGGLGGLPLDLGDLFEEAYLKGARIHNNSWGSATASRYTMNSSEVDEFVSRRRDMLIVISAGNEGNAAPPRTNAQLGFVDWLSIGSPASCKNALTVGASRSDRTQHGYSTLTWGAGWPAKFPDAPIGGELVSGDPQGLAAFSSRGPCDDRRIKPDVVAPGTDIASAKSSSAPLGNFWGPYPGNSSYAFMGGTSMAAPLVSGCAALVREYFSNTPRDHDSSAALLKATLINGAAWLGGPDATAPDPGMPNYHQGFGCVRMVDTIPNPARPQLGLEFVDNWQQPGEHFATSGQRRRYMLTLAGPAASLRICLAYTDAPGRGLQNNLNLFVEVPGGGKLIGNARLPRSLNIPDPDNNVELVSIQNAAAGNYLIQIAATNILKPPQDFALVVTGENVSGLAPI